MKKFEEKKLLELQLKTTSIFVASLIISLILTYNDYLRIDDKEFLDDKLSNLLGISNRSLVVILSIIYLYINIKNKEISKEKSNLYDLQINSGILSLISSIIVLYVVIKNNNYSIVSTENPNS